MFLFFWLLLQLCKAPPSGASAKSHALFDSLRYAAVKAAPKLCKNLSSSKPTVPAHKTKQVCLPLVIAAVAVAANYA